MPLAATALLTTTNAPCSLSPTSPFLELPMGKIKRWWLFKSLHHHGKVFVLGFFQFPSYQDPGLLTWVAEEANKVIGFLSSF